MDALRCNSKMLLLVLLITSHLCFLSLFWYFWFGNCDTCCFKVITTCFWSRVSIFCLLYCILMHFCKHFVTLLRRVLYTVYKCYLLSLSPKPLLKYHLVQAHVRSSVAKAKRLVLEQRGTCTYTDTFQPWVTLWSRCPLQQRKDW